jgi:hypothetical protein
MLTKNKISPDINNQPKKLDVDNPTSTQPLRSFGAFFRKYFLEG